VRVVDFELQVGGQQSGTVSRVSDGLQLYAVGVEGCQVVTWGMSQPETLTVSNSSCPALGIVAPRVAGLQLANLQIMIPSRVRASDSRCVLRPPHVRQRKDLPGCNNPRIYGIPKISCL